MSRSGPQSPAGLGTLRIGLVGAGRIGKVHANCLAGLEGVQLTAVADHHPEAANELARKHGAAHVFEHGRSMLAECALDAVIIASSTDTHADLIEAAAARKLHIFCEKPVDLSLARIDAAIAAVEAAGVHLQVGFNRRFDPNFARVQQGVAAGEIGTPNILRITSRDPSPPPLSYVKRSGGMFLDMSIHDFDMARFVMGSEITAVYCVAGCRVDPAIGEAGDVDTALITLEFANGAMACIDNSREAVYGYDQRIEVLGSEGMLASENQTETRTLLATREGITRPKPLPFFMTRYLESFRIELAAFVHALRTGTKPPVDGREARVPVLVALAAMRSAAEGRRVLLSEFG